jgi:hypothetical protein
MDCDGSGGAGCEHECCLLACRCWLDIRIRLDLSSSTKLLLLLPLLVGLGVSAANMLAHAQKYRAAASEEPLIDGAQRSSAMSLYLRMRLAFILVLTAAPVLGTVAWLQLYFGGHAAEADAVVMLYEAVAINCYLQMVISYCGGRAAIAAVLEAKDQRVLWMIPINKLPEDASRRAQKCVSCCMKCNCKIYTFNDSANLLRFWERSVLQMLPVKGMLAVLVVLTNRVMDDRGESMRIPINLANVVSMILAIRANVALYFELQPQLAGMRPLLKYMSCRMVLSACLSQRFWLDVTVVNPDDRFELLNFLLVIEMAVRQQPCAPNPAQPPPRATWRASAIPCLARAGTYAPGRPARFLFV